MATEPIGVHLACDVGAARIGIARSDPHGLLATPLPAVTANDDAIAQIARLAADVQAVTVVVGYPIGMNGVPGAAAERAEAWAAALERALTIPVSLFDERLSTVQAQRRLHEGGRNTRSSRAVIDSAAAAVILDSYLDQRRRESDHERH